MYRSILVILISILSSVSYGQEKKFIGNWRVHSNWSFFYYKIRKNHQAMYYSSGCTDRGTKHKGTWKSENDTITFVFDEKHDPKILKLYAKDGNLFYLKGETPITRTNRITSAGAVRERIRERKKERRKYEEDTSLTLQTGIYRLHQATEDSSWSSNLKLFPDHTFSFDDKRWRSCHFWSLFKGDWNIQSDTLTLSWYNELEYYLQQFIISTNQLASIRTEKKSAYYNWGIFDFISAELKEENE